MHSFVKSAVRFLLLASDILMPDYNRYYSYTFIQDNTLSKSDRFNYYVEFKKSKKHFRAYAKFH